MSKARKPTKPELSRREFARGVAITAATALVPNASLPAQAVSPQATPLSPDAEALGQLILARYGKRLSDEQKIEVRRLVAQAQKSSATLHSFPLENSDEPAMIFHIYRSGRR